jgi:cysteine-rich repeat protein
MGGAHFALAAWLLVAGACVQADDALAIYDMSGKWLVNGHFDFGVPDSVVTYYSNHWEVIQSSGNLSVSIDNGGPIAGTIDANTGDFEVGNYYFGSVAADGKSFTDTWVDEACAPAGCIYAYGTEAGTRCGNGDLDDGEACDDNNGVAGDCCSPTCTFEAGGAACTSDDNICTDDVCDGAGTCEHNDNAAPCADADGCTAGTCQSGACALTTPVAAGTSCDLDASVCTVDACDGAGNCAAGGSLDCAPCGACDGTYGCVLDTSGCDTAPSRIDILVRLGGLRNRLKMTLRDGIPVADFGDPTTDTEYTLCLYEKDASEPISRLILQATVPGGATCGTQPCWESDAERIRFKTSNYAIDGIREVRLDFPTNSAFQYITFRSKRGQLALPAEFAPDIESLTPKIVASDGVTNKCWTHPVGLGKVSYVLFKSIYSSLFP